MLVGGLTGIQYAVVGMFAGLLPLLILLLCRGIGAGDVKFFAAYGAWMGATFVLQTMMYAILYAGFVGMMLFIFKQDFCKRVVRLVIMWLTPLKVRDWVMPRFDHAELTRFPFMIATVPGAVTAWLMIGVMG
jgi:prepilin peptidase CpaA